MLSQLEAKKMLEVLMLMMVPMLMMLMMVMMVMMMTELEEAVWAATVTNAAAWRAHTYTRNDYGSTGFEFEVSRLDLQQMI